MNQSKSLIYSIQCIPTGLLYVGMTRQQLKMRVRMHRYNAKKPTKRNKLYLSIQEHGWDNHKVSVVEEVTDDTLLEERECYYIDKWDTRRHGLNTNPGGGVFPRLSGEEHPMFGRTHTPEARAKIRDNHADFRGEKNPNYGRQLTEEHKQKLSRATKGVPKPHSAEHHKNRLAVIARHYLIVYKDGTQEQIQNLKQYARDNGLTERVLHDIINKNKPNKRGKHKHILSITRL